MQESIGPGANMVMSMKSKTDAVRSLLASQAEAVLLLS